ncbi:hypothetical protein EK904_013924 [Melospiza melodia maxima]|nr:hypothetical protein EK904_013924 [Melospiza melodia maxima]
MNQALSHVSHHPAATSTPAPQRSMAMSQPNLKEISKTSERLGYLRSVAAHGEANNCSAVASDHSCAWVRLFIAALEWLKETSFTVMLILQRS